MDLRPPVPRDGETPGFRALRQELLVGNPASSSGRRPTRRCEGLILPGYEPFLLCDFHVHTTWSDGRLSLREVVDLYGQTGRFDVIAITDHILMRRDLLGRAGRLASLGRRHFSVTEERFDAYLADIAGEAERARRLYDLLVVPGAEILRS
jgi:hypothetical protein